MLHMNVAYVRSSEFAVTVDVLVPAASVHFDVELYVAATEQREIKPSTRDLVLWFGIESARAQRFVDSTFPSAVEDAFRGWLARIGGPGGEALQPPHDPSSSKVEVAKDMRDSTRPAYRHVQASPILLKKGDRARSYSGVNDGREQDQIPFLALECINCAHTQARGESARLREPLADSLGQRRHLWAKGRDHTDTTVVTLLDKKLFQMCDDGTGFRGVHIAAPLSHVSLGRDVRPVEAGTCGRWYAQSV